MNSRTLDNRDLGEGWWRIELECPELARSCRAGQFVQVRIGTGDDPLIRRPFSVYDVTPTPGDQGRCVQLLYQVVGPGTRWMSRRQAGEPVDLLGPLGRPFPTLRGDEHREVVLVGGGIGVAPLYFYCREWLQEGATTPLRVLLGARRASLLVGREAFLALPVATLCATDDGSHGHAGNVIELLTRELEDRGHDGVTGIGCGPHGMNQALREFVVTREIPFWISLENYMPCGFGACFGCVIRVPGSTPPRYRRVCVEGPCFRAEEIPADA